MNGEREGGRPPSRPPPKKNKMNGLVFYIGLGLGLALAAGLRPFLPALLAGAPASSGVLGRELRAQQLSTSCRPVGGCWR